MPRSSQTRLGLASEQPGTCTGPPRLPSPQGAEQEARMNAFVPPGYLSFDDAIDRVAEITMLARESTSPAAHIAKGTFAKEVAMTERRLLGKEELRKRLHAEKIPSAVITEDGSCHPTPGHIWGGEQWNEALYYNRITFPDNRYVSAYVSGRPIIPKDALEEAFNTDGPVKAETHRRDVEIFSLFKTASTANPQAKRRRIYEIMRGLQPNLFKNRREPTSGKILSDQSIGRIIREQQRQ